jgi:sec-independent protein translocase protein TatB
MIGKVRRMASEFQGQFQEAMREADMADLKKQVDAIGDVTRGVKDLNPIEAVRREMESVMGDTGQDTRHGSSSASSSSVSTSSSYASNETTSSAGSESHASSHAIASPEVATAAADPIVQMPEPVVPVTDADFRATPAPAEPAASPPKAP